MGTRAGERAIERRRIGDRCWSLLVSAERGQLLRVAARQDRPPAALHKFGHDETACVAIRAEYANVSAIGLAHASPTFASARPTAAAMSINARKR